MASCRQAGTRLAAVVTVALLTVVGGVPLAGALEPGVEPVAVEHETTSTATEETTAAVDEAVETLDTGTGALSDPIEQTVVTLEATVTDAEEVVTPPADETDDAADDTTDDGGEPTPADEPATGDGGANDDPTPSGATATPAADRAPRPEPSTADASDAASAPDQVDVTTDHRTDRLVVLLRFEERQYQSASSPPGPLVSPSSEVPDPMALVERTPWPAAFDPGAYTRSPGARTTQPILDLLADASPALVARILAPFPVAGLAVYTDDWAAPRFVPTPHPHEGVDIFAARGTPVTAAADGVVTAIWAGTAVSGNAVRLTEPDGTYYFYAHLDGFAPDLALGRRVTAGDVLGYVGDTGNAVGTPPHLHFEIHPGGGGPVPPVPFLDAWLEQARVEAAGFHGVATPLVTDMVLDVRAPEVAPGKATATTPAPAASPPLVFQRTEEPRDAPATVALLAVVALLLWAWQRSGARPRGAKTRRGRQGPPARDALTGVLASSGAPATPSVRSRGPAGRDALAPLLDDGRPAEAPAPDHELARV